MLESFGMQGPYKAIATMWIVALTMLLVLSCGRRIPPQPGDADVAEPAGEPEQYSATVVRIVEEGAGRETTTSREARSGDLRREEWTEQGRNRALIWRPDLGKSFLLDLDRRAYVEIDITDDRAPKPREGAGDPSAVSIAGNAEERDPPGVAVQAVDRYFDDRRSPSRVETRVLPQAVIDGHLCAVDEQTSVFPEGHAEIRRRFRAVDLSGLALRVESGSEPGSTKVITERHDVRTEVPPEAFIIPPDFKKVEKLPG